MKYVSILLILCGELCAQGVTIGSSNPPAPSAGLHLDFQDKGFLMPRLTSAQRDSISGPALGLQIFNITTECVEVYFSSGWQPTACECQQAPAAPVSISGNTTFCPNQLGVTYSVAPASGAISYQWSVPPGSQISSGSGTSTIVVSMGAAGGNVSVSAVNNCGTSSPAVLAVSPQTPDPSFGPISGSPGSPVTFASQSGASAYQWTFQNGTPSSSSQSSPQVTWSSAGTYSVQLTVTDANGCSDSLTQTVSIVSCQAFTQSFSTCGATGQSGPSQSQCNAAYGNGIVTVSGNGIQQWNVPQTGTYRITAAGGAGGSATSGGAIIRAELTLTAGQTLNLLVGQAGTNSGGGGGSFVVDGNGNPLLIAGGGGAWNNGPWGVGQTTELGGNPAPGASLNPVGQGGKSFNSTSSAGGGFSTNGEGIAPGQSYLNGGLGGISTTNIGGFGGGGARTGSCGSGGGGGYSGGNVDDTCNPGNYTGGGGGGSFINPSASSVATSNGSYNSSGLWNGQAITNIGSQNNGAGYINLELICP